MSKMYLIYFNYGYDGTHNLGVFSSEEDFHKFFDDLKAAIKEKRPEFFLGDEKFVYSDFRKGFTNKDYPALTLTSIADIDCQELPYLSKS